MTTTATRRQNRPTSRTRKRAFAYLRVSSAGQVNTDYDPEGISLPAQRAAIQRRAAELDAEIVEEFVEPGRSATSTDKRPKFQEMMARLKAEGGIDYVIVYARSRLHRNAIDSAITKGDLRKVGATIISVMDYTEDSAIGDLVATVLDGVNEYQSRASGADIAYKMGQKAINGGCLGRAPIGYLNVRETFDGREVRTVAIDPDRAPLVRMAFELYATGTYTFRSLLDALNDAGLRTRPHGKRHAGRPLSIHKLGDLLRDRFYLGYVTYKDQEHPGRHEPLISEELFEKVQDMLKARGSTGTRERTHHHYLKGTVWCHRCKGRLIIARARSKTGAFYFYFMCMGRQRHTCDLPHLPVERVETAVLDLYATLVLPADLRARITARMEEALQESDTINAELHKRVAEHLAKLETQEDHFLDLIGDKRRSQPASTRSATNGPGSPPDSTASNPTSPPDKQLSAKPSTCSPTPRSCTAAPTSTPAKRSTARSSPRSTSTPPTTADPTPQPTNSHPRSRRWSTSPAAHTTTAAPPGVAPPTCSDPPCVGRVRVTPKWWSRGDSNP